MRVRAGKSGRPGSMAKSGISHVGLTVDDVETSVEFYRDILGLDSRRSKPGVARLRSGRDRVVLHEKSIGGSGFHFGFGVGSLSKVNEWEAWLRNRRIAIYDDVSEKRYRSFKVRDPDGYFLEIFCDKRAIAR